MKKCPYCAEEIHEEAIKCKHCGSDITDKKPRTEKVVSAKAQGVPLGLSAGLAVGFFIGLVGVVLTLTGIGAVIGVPLIIGGIMAPIVGFVFGCTTIKGHCPYCNQQVFSYLKMPGLKCPACNNQIVVRNKLFIKAEDVHLVPEVSSEMKHQALKLTKPSIGQIVGAVIIIFFILFIIIKCL